MLNRKIPFRVSLETSHADFNRKFQAIIMEESTLTTSINGVELISESDAVYIGKYSACSFQLRTIGNFHQRPFPIQINGSVRTEDNKTIIEGTIGGLSKSVKLLLLLLIACLLLIASQVVSFMAHDIKSLLIGIAILSLMITNVYKLGNSKGIAQKEKQKFIRHLKAFTS